MNLFLDKNFIDSFKLDFQIMDKISIFLIFVDDFAELLLLPSSDESICCSIELFFGRSFQMVFDAKK